MPLFFLLSGITFRVHENECFFSFFIRKFRILMIPYYSFGIFAIVVFLVMGNYAESALNKQFDLSFLTMSRNLLYGSSQNGALKFYEPLWFLPCLFSIQVISFFVWGLLQRFFNRHLLCRSCIICLFIIMFMILNAFQPSVVSSSCVTKIPILFSTPLPMGLNMAFREFPFFLIGLLFQKNFLTNSNMRVVNLIVCVFAITLGMLTFLIEQRLRLPLCLCCYYLWVLFFYFTGLFSSLGYIFLCRVICHSELFSRIGRETIPILVLHKYPIIFVSVAWSFGSRMISENKLWFCVLLSFAVAGISMLVGFVLKRFVPFLFGLSYEYTRNGLK